MYKWRKCNWCYLLSLFLCVFLLTSCSTIKMPSFIRALANDQTQNNVEESSVPAADNQTSLLDGKLRKKDKEITELRASLNNLSELKAKIDDKNNEISRLQKELDRIIYLNNSQTNQISRLKNELENSTNPNNAQENEITRLRNEIDQTKNSKQARTFEGIEESGFFEPEESGFFEPVDGKAK